MARGFWNFEDGLIDMMNSNGIPSCTLHSIPGKGKILQIGTIRSRDSSLAGIRDEHSQSWRTATPLQSQTSDSACQRLVRIAVHDQVRLDEDTNVFPCCACSEEQFFFCLICKGWCLTSRSVR
ncbi:unnamed protein product [Heligmosomoides polygyrus]|uniref:RING/FYVE/PHD zinc finger superfamily protein n=1 Tax=Heligmosomoides polygyrus TaxID=6339 RepID=A0A183G4I5_HELPZ|nr:unnamed protein product [Heligmosomoides polygyrus]